MVDQAAERQGFSDLRPDDVYATPGTDLTRKNHACVYELYEGKKIVGNYRGEDGKVIDNFLNFSIPDEAGMTKLTSVRAVHSPYTCADDPASTYMKGVNYVVYGGGCTPKSEEKNHQGTFDRILVMPNGLGHSAGGLSPIFLSAPVDQAKGIAVDQDYLWVFAKDEFYCATHASLNSVASVVTGRGSLPAVNWMRFTSIPNTTHGIEAFYPCNDGTLLVSTAGGTELYTATYRADSNRIKANRTTPLPWTKIENGRVDGGLEKLPVFCWPQFESLKETLEALQKVFFHS